MTNPPYIDPHSIESFEPIEHHLNMMIFWTCLQGKTIYHSFKYISLKSSSCGFPFQDCRVGEYGPDCKEKCMCENGGMCNIVTGRCTCSPGFLGPTCQETCPEGRYGDTCAESCPCVNGGRCDVTTGTCRCPAGFTGDRCELGINWIK